METMISGQQGNAESRDIKHTHHFGNLGPPARGCDQRARGSSWSSSVPVEVELDRDDDAVSVRGLRDGTAVGTGRLLPGSIGRMAVRKRARGLGVGGQILDALIGQGHGDGHRMLVLHAQTRRRFLRSARVPGGRRGIWKAALPMS